MNQKLQNLLYEKYPKIFVQKDLPMQETAMCWGIACGDGWYDLIDTLCQQIQGRVTAIERKDPEFICQAIQVKEKFGGLRFYTYGGDEYIQGMISLAESLSYKICSSCGVKKKPADLTDRSWVYTKCNTCNN